MDIEEKFFPRRCLPGSHKGYEKFTFRGFKNATGLKATSSTFEAELSLSWMFNKMTPNLHFYLNYSRTFSKEICVCEVRWVLRLPLLNKCLSQAFKQVFGHQSSAVCLASPD